MKLIEKYIISAERILPTLYLIILVIAALGAVGFLPNITFIGAIAVFWPPMFLSALVPAFYSAVLFYIILFTVPILGIYSSGRKNINLHVSLLITLLLLLGIHLYFLYEAWKT